MRTITVELFKFAELSEDAKKIALANVRNKFLSHDDFDYSEYKASLDAFCNDLGIEINDWSYGLDGCDVDYSLDNVMGDRISGARLYTWIMNNVKGLQPGPRVYTVPRDVVRYGFKSVDHVVKRMSGIYRAADCCNYTGVCHDETLLQPFREFLKNPTDETQLADLIRDAIDGYCSAMLEELEYQETDEYTADYIDGNGDDLEFTAYGSIHE